MNIRDVIMRHYIRVQKLSGMLTLVLMIFNLSGQVAIFVTWRGWSPWAIIPTLAAGLGVIVILVANVVVVGFRLYHHEGAASAAHSPQQTYAATPFQESTWRNISIPHLRSLENLCRNLDQEEVADEFAQIAERVEHWADLGYIPREDAPEHLHKHYMGSQGDRL